jgi:hypothetical protein
VRSLETFGRFLGPPIKLCRIKGKIKEGRETFLDALNLSRHAWSSAFKKSGTSPTLTPRQSDLDGSGKETEIKSAKKSVNFVPL